MKAIGIALLLAPLCVACAPQNIIASYGGVTQPVLLGPVDHLGPGPALKTRAVSQKMHTEFSHVVSSGSNSTTEEWTSKAKGLDSAKEAMGTDLQRDVRVTALDTSAKGSMLGITMSAEVEVEGDVVEVESKP
jgi:hypothetical protein